MSVTAPAAAGHAAPANPRSRVVLASLVGTTIEFYDFYVYATAAVLVFPHLFFPAGNETTALLASFAVFGAAMVARPLGAIFFGHIGDRHGRKYAFILTIALMGFSTLAIGLVPGAATIGIAAPILLVVLRILQGFALGGEYGGAAVYVAEHADPARRGFLTGWIQSTASVGLLLALGIVLATRSLLGEEAFQAWGWRIPFLMSAVLLVISMWIRLRLSESPAFQKMKAEMRTSTAPVREAFRGENLRRMIIALFAILLAQGAVWYTAHFYAQFFLERVLKVDPRLVNELVMVAVLLSAGGYVFFGWLSDRWGRKPVMLLGMVISVVAYFPAFNAMTAWGNPGLLAAVDSAPVTVVAPAGECHLQFDALGRRKLQSDCDVARTVLADAGIPYHQQVGQSGVNTEVRVGARVIPGGDAALLRATLEEAGYAKVADRAAARPLALLGVLLLLMLASTALYGPQAAALVELFPTQVRYTALSVPYNIGVGWVGGLLPVSAFALVAARGEINAGLIYPLAFTLVSIVCTLLFLPETRGVPLHENRPTNVT
ncbi:MAG: MHS family MFS transporter, partial [Pseudomonadota bacterium]|nr:MHS family MFS transporter [Pseudomonadota bacterium]